VSSFDSSRTNAGFPTGRVLSVHSKTRECGDGHTDVYGEISDGRKEDLDIRTGDEFGVHPSSILEEGTTQ